MNKPENVFQVRLNNKYVDRWTVYVSNESGETETLCCSDDPDHPQGVFSMTSGYYISATDEEKNWDDLPKTLKKFIINYLTNKQNVV